MVLAAFLLYFLLMNIFAHVHVNQMESNTARTEELRLLEIIEDDMQDMLAMAESWALSSDARNSVATGSSSYAVTNMPVSALIHTDTNIAIITDTYGAVIYHSFINPDSGDEMPVPSGLMEHLSPSGILGYNPDADSSVAGLVQLDDVLIMAASHPITDADNEELVRGAIILGRLLDEKQIDRMNDELSLSFNLFPLNAAVLPEDIIAAIAQLTSGPDNTFTSIGDENIAVYSLLPDIYGEPAAVVQTLTPRVMYQQSTRIYGMLMGIVIIVAALAVSLYLWFFQRRVINRLNVIITGLGDIRRSGNFSQRVVTSGSDELTDLGSSINRTLAALENTRQDLSDKNAELYQQGEKLRELFTREAVLRKKSEDSGRIQIAFVRALVHEIKNPLTPLLASSETLAETATDKQLQKLAANIHRSARNLNERVDELMDSIRSEKDTLKVNLLSTDLAPLLREMASEIRPMFEKRRQIIRTDIPENLPAVKADVKRIRQVVFNLLDNATKYTREGGRINLSAGTSDNRLYIEVSDNGIGISETDQARLFEPYFRVSRGQDTYSGLGLGLLLCKRLVKLHKGTISVVSRQGEGTTFRVELPLARNGKKATRDKESAGE